MSAESFYHIGIVVPNIEDAQAHLTAILDLAWGPLRVFDNTIIDPSGIETPVSLKVAFSLNEPRFELIEEIPHSPWACNPYSNIHHIGFFTDDVNPVVDRLSRASCPLEWTIPSGTVDERELYTTYSFDRLGIRIEFSPSAIKPRLEEEAFKPARHSPI